jgi:hypothetical protein
LLLFVFCAIPTDLIAGADAYSIRPSYMRLRADTARQPRRARGFCLPASAEAVGFDARHRATSVGKSKLLLASSAPGVAAEHCSSVAY